VLTRIEELAPGLVTTFNAVVFQCTLGIWNKTTVENLIALLSKKDVPVEVRSAAHTLMNVLTRKHGELFKDFVPALMEWIISQSKEISLDRDRDDKLAVEDVLKCLARLDNVELPGKQGKEFLHALKKFALSGETAKQGRRAATILVKLKRGSVYADDLLQVYAIGLCVTIGNCSVAVV
jgi:Sister chromatid cohesion protein PDS5 protein